MKQVGADLTIVLGRERLAVNSPSPGWLQQAGCRFADFRLASAPCDAQLRYRPVAEVPLPDLAAWARRRGVAVGPSLQIAGAGFRGRFDPSGRKVDLAGVDHTYPLDVVLPQLWYTVAPHGLLLHAAMLDLPGGAAVASGNSGCGKSTLAGLMGSAACADEIVAIEPTAHGLVVSSLPFWRGRPATVPLQQVLLLEHGNEHQQTRLRSSAAFALLGRQVLWPYDALRAERALATLELLVATTRVSRFAFRPTRDVAEALVA